MRVPAPRPSRRAAGVSALAAAALLAAAAATTLGERLDTTIALGKTATLTVTAPGDVASAGFLVHAGTGRKLQCIVRPAKKSKLTFGEVRLVGPDGTSYDAAGIAGIGGKVKATSKLVTITLTNFPAGQTGLWKVQVRGAAGASGQCTLQVKGTDVSTLTASSSAGDPIPANGVLTKTLDVGSNQAITVTLTKAVKTSALVPRLKIVDPSGTELGGGQFLGVRNTKKGTLTLKSFRLPVFGQYRLLISGENGAGGNVKIVAKTAVAKAAKGAPVALPAPGVDGEPSANVTLDGTGSTGSGQLQFSWSQVSGDAVTLTGPATAAPTFRAPADAGTLAFELAVAVNGVWSAPAVLPVEIGGRPLADAGRSQAVQTGAAVTLDGSGSLDRRGSGITHQWRQDPNDATQVTLSGAATAAPTFTAPSSPALLHFGLVVDDGTLRSFEDWVTVRAGDTSQPTPDAGRAQIVPRMATVHLSGLATLTASGALDVPLQWTKVSGPSVTLDDPTSPWPAFTAPKTDADFVFRLTTGGASDLVAVHVRSAETDLAPLTVGNGIQTAASGSVPLSATTSTDPDAGTSLAFRWAQIAGPALSPADPRAGATTVNLPAGNAVRTYAVQASDGLAYGPPDTVIVRNTGSTGDPVARATATPAIANASQTVQLSGVASFRSQGTGPLTYRWRQISGKDWYDVDAADAGFDPAAASPSFALPVDLSSITQRRTLAFELIVNDGTADSAPDLVTVTFVNVPKNGKPLVSAGASTTNPIAGGVVTLQANPSDRDGDPVTVQWAQISGPNVTLGPNNQSVSPSFAAPASGTLVFRVIANDGFDDSDPSQISIVVDAAPTAAISMNPTSGAPGTAVGVDATGSTDPETPGASLSYTWSCTPAGAITVPTGTTTRVWGFQAPAASVTVNLVVNDGRQNSTLRSQSFQVGLPVSVSPSASLTSAPYGANVSLNANATGGGTINYQWRQLTSADGAQYTNNPSVGTITGAASATASFTVPKPTTGTGFGASPSATFQVTANNGSNQAVGTVTVTFFASYNDKNNAGIGTTDKVWGILGQSCQGAGCHNGTTNNCSGYGMGNPTAARTNNINVNACSGSKKRVDPTNGSSASYLVDRLKGIASPLMPSTGALPPSQIALIADWIDQGALDN